MKYRLYIPNIDPNIDQILDANQFHHLVKVLRIEHLELIEILNGKGHVFEGVFHLESKKTAVLKNIKCIKTHAMPEKKLTLIIGITKLSTLDTILQKATEMGVWTIQPVFSEFTPIKKNLLYSENKQEHWQKILQSSLIQSANPWLPELKDPINITDIAPGSDLMVLHPYADHVSMNELENIQRIAIGPEGGWSENEILFYKKCGSKIISFPSPIMRAETCVIAGLAILHL